MLYFRDSIPKHNKIAVRKMGKHSNFIVKSYGCCQIVRLNLTNVELTSSLCDARANFGYDDHIKIDNCPYGHLLPLFAEGDAFVS